MDLSAALVDRVLARFALAAPPVTRTGAEQLFAAWCAHVSFDNVLKRIALHEGRALPGLNATSFFEDYLATGAAGTCWATSGALCDLYRALGFQARRASALMRADLVTPVSGAAGHGTVLLAIDGESWMADASILCGTLIPLRREVTSAGGPLTPLTATPDERGLWHVQFRSGHADTPMFCQLIALDVEPAFFAQRYEASRIESGFNARLMARKNKPHVNEIVVLRTGTRFVRTVGGIASAPLTDRVEALVRDIGIERSVAARTPADQ
jgi:arylamine N-acetyltransferase